MISELASTEFSLTLWKSTVDMCADESIHQLWKQFRWWFLRRHWLRFPQLSLSQQRLCALTNPCVSSWSSFSDDVWVGNDSVSHEYFLVNRGCVRRRIHVSTHETVSVMIYELAATQISLTIFESTGAVCADESMRELWKQFQWSFLSQQRLSFPWLFKSRGATCADESMRQLCKQLRRWFLSRWRLSFPWIFMSQ